MQPHYDYEESVDVEALQVQILTWLAIECDILLMTVGGRPILRTQVPPGVYTTRIEGIAIRVRATPDGTLHVYGGSYAEISIAQEEFVLTMQSIPNMRRYHAQSTPSCI